VTTLSRVLLLGVDGYRRFGSPRTGPCPHRLRCGGRSCSAYGRRALERHGVIAGVRLIRRRLVHCRASAAAMLAAQEVPDAKQRRGRRAVVDSAAVACCATELLTSFSPCSS
jgi:putative component of membrane protein insertase Oxa1/YidC/SpoIIIJ protein YidD